MSKRDWTAATTDPSLCRDKRHTAYSQKLVAIEPFASVCYRAMRGITVSTAVSLSLYDTPSAAVFLHQGGMRGQFESAP